jgi:hypothetical protein
MAAILVRLPLQTDFFGMVEEDLVRDGTPGPAAWRRVRGVLRALPLRIAREELRERVAAERDALVARWAAQPGLTAADAVARADAAIAALFTGWRTPRLRRGLCDGRVGRESGVPLRAIVAYLFAEVARCFRMVRGRTSGSPASRSPSGATVVRDRSRAPAAGGGLVRRADWERGRTVRPASRVA